MKRLILVAMLVAGCAGARTVGIDMERKEVTVCGKRFADEGDLREEASTSCVSGRTVLLRAGTATGLPGNCAVYRCE